MDNQDFWIFGYGSLIWKPPIFFDKRVPGYIKGYVRRFWQVLRYPRQDPDQPEILMTTSEDHRGTPEAPGRVVTLIERSFWKTLGDVHKTGDDDLVWGVAYHIPQERVAEVKEYLDLREINGYSIQHTPFHPADPQHTDINCLVYIGMPENPQFLGALDPQDVANKINESVGPSGENRDYLLNLEKALLELGPDSHDGHITDLAQRVRALVPRVQKT